MIAYRRKELADAHGIGIETLRHYEGLACFHWCPKRAIQIGAYTRGSPRYHHPKVSFTELATR